MAENEVYMLKRDSKETDRLNYQHGFLHALNGNLIHPSVPKDRLRAVADVATGTGIWLRELPQELKNVTHQVTYVGFDISPAQFPASGIPGVDLVTHDASQPFPSKYHGKFDLVNVRFLSYALKEEAIPKVVESLTKILKPGGYLQWQELDAIDTWSVPETEMAKEMISCIVDERLARGLPPAIVTPLISAIRSIKTNVGEDDLNTISWSNDGLRIVNLEMTTTEDHPSAIVAAGMRAIVGPGSIELLQSSRERLQAALKKSDDGNLVPNNRKETEASLKKVEKIIGALERNEDPASNIWHTEITRLIAQKALKCPKSKNWMSIRRGFVDAAI